MSINFTNIANEFIDSVGSYTHEQRIAMFQLARKLDDMLTNKHENYEALVNQVMRAINTLRIYETGHVASARHILEDELKKQGIRLFTEDVKANTEPATFAPRTYGYEVEYFKHRLPTGSGINGVWRRLSEGADGNEHFTNEFESIAEEQYCHTYPIEYVVRYIKTGTFEFVRLIFNEDQFKCSCGAGVREYLIDTLGEALIAPTTFEVELAFDDDAQVWEGTQPDAHFVFVDRLEAERGCRFFEKTLKPKATRFVSSKLRPTCRISDTCQINFFQKG